jgi:hypothetical protein
MRIRIVRKPTTASIDGIRLDLFEPGREFDVGPTLAALLLVERFAEPVIAEARPEVQAPDPPAPPATPLLPRPSPVRPDAMPPNLHREICPPYLDRAIAAEAVKRPRNRRRARKLPRD